MFVLRDENQKVQQLLVVALILNVLLLVAIKAL